MKEEKIEILCHDGVKLHGLLLLPLSPAGSVVQINSGTAVKKEFYKPFAQYLVSLGHIGFIWDNRAVGESAPSDLKKCTYTFSDYGIKDMPAVKEYLQQRFHDLPILLLAHSAGAQQTGLMKNLPGYKGMLASAVSAGYRPHMPLKYRLKALYFFNIFGPLSIFFSGYVKAKQFGYMEDLPRKVLLEWKAWCKHQEYLFHPEFSGSTLFKGWYENMPFPIEVLFAADDTISSEANVENFWKNIKSIHEINFTKMVPADFNCTNIDHFGYFKKSNADKIWPFLVQKINLLLS